MKNLERNCFYRMMFLFHLYLGILMPGAGDFCFVFLTRGRSFALKSCPGSGDFDGKNLWPGSQPGGDGNRSN